MTLNQLLTRGALAAAALSLALSANAHLGWPANYDGVMLQGFYWDSYTDSQWSNLEKQADEFAEFFKLVWVPQSGDCNSSWNQMGYSPVYFFSHNSSFGSEAQLRSMISTFKAKGIGTIEDVVINHHNNLGVGGSWVDFPAETYKGTTYQLLPSDVVKDDDKGKTATWATSQGISISSNYDTGEDWDGMRDLDHKSQNVQNICKAYLNFLLNDLGYTGFRYDMTKGFGAQYMATYNDAAKPAYSVGEYWDGDITKVEKWLDGTKDASGVMSSAAFDYPFRYSVRDAVNKSNNWSALKTGGLNTTTAYKQFSVSFVENHDTQYRSESEPNDPINQNIAAANAYLLAMPGTPCVFLRHWLDYKEEIKQMIYARQLAGITNTSATFNMRSSAAYYAQRTTGTKGYLMVVCGSGYEPSTSTYVKVAEGTNYSYWLQRTINSAWASKPSGTYYGAFDVTLTAIAPAGTKLVYTTDGSEPTAQSTQVADGASINISKDCTLKVGLLADGAVTGVITRNYTVESFEAHTATVYLKDPSWDAVHFYAWDANGTLNGAWPGDAITATKTIGGSKYYYKSFDVATPTYTFNIIFDKGSSEGQTVDIGPINKDVYYEISGTNTAGKYLVTDITDQVNGGGTKGDLNGDGLVNAADVTALVNMIATGSATASADLTGDGLVNVADVTALVNIILGIN